MLRIIEALQSRWIIGENVKGFVNQPMGLQRSLSDLESIGYKCVTFLLPACSKGAFHRRDRVWIIATNVADAAAQRLEVGTGGKIHQQKAQQRFERCGADVAHAESFRTQRHGTSGQQKSHAHAGEKVFMRGSKRPAPTQWATEPDVGRVAHGVPNRTHRIKALGNAVVPQVVEQIGRAIIECERQR